MALEPGGPLTAAASEETASQEMDAETPANGTPAYEAPGNAYEAPDDAYEAPDNDVSPADEPVPETPADEAPVTDEPDTDELASGVVVTDVPVTDESVTSAVVTDVPVTDTPAADVPAAETYPSDTPPAETYPSETPLVSTAASETAAADTPAAGIPVADAPTTEAPATEARPDAADRPDDGPLLPDASELRVNWQRVQASFVDNPQSAVAEAADLVDHVAQALAGALRQRQTRLREQWDTGGPEHETETETLRVTLQQYRAVFNQICRD